jgi:hypothetical protein
MVISISQWSMVVFDLFGRSGSTVCRGLFQRDTVTIKRLSHWHCDTHLNVPYLTRPHVAACSTERHPTEGVFLTGSSASFESHSY